MDNQSNLTLKELNRIRGRIKAKLTNTTKFVDSHAPDIDVQKDIFNIKQKIELMSEIKQELGHLFQNYLKIDQDDPSASECDTAMDDLEDQRDKLEVSLKCLLSKIECNNNKKDINVKSSIDLNAKLPDIPLPLFYGKFEEFSTFKNQFISIISENEKLSDNHKLYYLRSCLKAEAKLVETSSDSYGSLMRALEQRYDNRRAVVDSHIQSILQIEKITCESSKCLRNITDTVKKNLRALKVLNLECNTLSEAVFVSIILQKLDKETRKAYELSLQSKEVPSLDELIEFLENRSLVLENVNKSAPIKPVKSIPNPANKNKNFMVNSNNSNIKYSPKSCILCDESHQLFKCAQFLSMSVAKRNEVIKAHKLCHRCLKAHSSPCKSLYKCRSCNSSAHSSLLHPDVEENNPDINTSAKIYEVPSVASPQSNQRGESKNSNKHFDTQASGASSKDQKSEFTLSCLRKEKEKTVLLCTAIALIENSVGERVPVKVILDSGSSVNICTNELACALGWKKEKVNTSISGINGGEYFVKNKINATISNEEGDFKKLVSFLVLPRITDFSPASRVDISNLRFPSGIKYANPKFYIPTKVHALLGCSLFFELLRAEKIYIPDSSVILQNTALGYLVTGTIQGEGSHFVGFISESDNLELSVQRFFELESFPGDSREGHKADKSIEEKYCEEHFVQTHERDETGRYVVRLPIKENMRSKLGHSKANAERRLNQIWKRLDADGNKSMAHLYKLFMEEYSYLNHMEKVVDNEHPSEEYFIPHCAVFSQSVSTPLRVVFDASAKTSTGISLNDILLNGGTVQEDLFSIVTRFRKHKFAFSADISKMYRQILVHPDDRNLQKILWKKSRFAPVETFKLKTVTYGTASASFLATRTMKALAEDEQKEFPKAAAVTLTDLYVDDVLSGGETIEETKELQSQLIRLLHRGGMKLHKWVSNHPDLLQDEHNAVYQFESQQGVVKTLGMRWHPKADCFTFKVDVNLQPSYTKREVLSIIARLFDPLGLIGPVLTRAKIFLQRLWNLKLDWSDPLPPNEFKDWLKFLKGLPAVNDLQIKRNVLVDNPNQIEVHGFSDASERAFGTTVYLRSFNELGEVRTALLCSKSRVSPIKALTIPRLELSAALLMARLVSKVVSILQLQVHSVYLWSDSTVTLAWVNTPPEKLKTFVSNRVKEINSLTQNCEWRYVSSKNNPADILSRGSGACDLQNNLVWWLGPDFLNSGIPAPEEMCVSSSDEFTKELKSNNEITLATSDTNFLNEFLNISNDYSKLIRILSYIYRFLHNSKYPGNKQTGPLTALNLRKAASALVKLTQAREFAYEISELKKGKQLKKGKLANLYAFLDEDQILRVGGRLANASLNIDKKHPKVLPKNHKFTRIVMEYFHRKNLHVGAQTLLHCVRQEFWPLGGRNLARKIINECVVCFKNKPKTCEQLLGNLPSERVNPSPPFSNCGIDFCGPFLIRYKGQRKGTLQKVYVAIFVCFASKAIHLEIVTDLTSNSLIATLKRFFARRGKASCLFSDNAGNFISANSEIKKLHKLVSKPQENLANYLTSENVNWKFIPPRTPSFGGLWESGVKSFKHHLKRAVGSYTLTIEEFLTVTTEIEGILNSRPISPMSSDPGDFEVLTPGHFLIGRPLNSIPEPDITQKPDNYLSRWQRTTKLVQLVWKKWNRDYLNHLQLRNKWQFKKDNVEPNAMVLLKNADLPPYKWRMGRIIETIKGSDGNVRVVVVKTSSGILKRGITQVCLLPINS